MDTDRIYRETGALCQAQWTKPLEWNNLCDIKRVWISINKNFNICNIEISKNSFFPFCWAGNCLFWVHSYDNLNPSRSKSSNTKVTKNTTITSPQWVHSYGKLNPSRSKSSNTKVTKNTQSHLSECIHMVSWIPLDANPATPRSAKNTKITSPQWVQSYGKLILSRSKSNRTMVTKSNAITSPQWVHSYGNLNPSRSKSSKSKVTKNTQSHLSECIHIVSWIPLEANHQHQGHQKHYNYISSVSAFIW